MNKPDVWQEKLIALLYGELDPADEREVRSRLESDANLRREWEAIKEGRQWLSALETNVAIPQFVFLHDSHEAPPRQVVAASVGERRWWNWGSPIWATAAAVFLMAILAVSDFRVQRLDGGLAFTFGDQPKQQETLGNPNAPHRRPDLAGTDNGKVELTPVSQTVGGESGKQYSSDELLYLVRTMIEDRDRHRDQEMTAILRAMYEDVGARQDRDYLDLKNRIKAMNVGMALDRQGLENRFNDLEGVQSLDIKAGPPANGQKEN